MPLAMSETIDRMLREARERWVEGKKPPPAPLPLYEGERIVETKILGTDGRVRIRKVPLLLDP